MVKPRNLSEKMDELFFKYRTVVTNGERWQLERDIIKQAASEVPKDTSGEQASPAQASQMTKVNNTASPSKGLKKLRKELDELDNTAPTNIEKFIAVRKSILEDMSPQHPDWKHHQSFLKLAEAIQADTAPSYPNQVRRRNE